MEDTKIVYCMMQQNRLVETKHCINLMLPYVNHIVVVDGGSCDDSLFYLSNLAEEEPKLNFYLHPWKDNFSEQRNNYLARAREVVGHDNFWYVISDPDEWYDKETLENLKDIVTFCDSSNINMAQLQCRSVTMKGEKRVWENLDNYWKGLIFKHVPGIKYIGNPHETLVIPGGLRPAQTPFIYEHIKQEKIIWHRGARNLYCGGGGPNMGTNNPLWIELKNIVKEVYGRELLWHEFDKELMRGNIDTRLKSWLFKAKDQKGYDGSCFIPGHYIGTPSGFSELNCSIEKYVIGVSGDVDVLERMESFYSGNVVELQGVNTAPVTVTSNHRILVLERNECTKNYRDLNCFCRPDCSQLVTKFREDKRNPLWSGEYKNCSNTFDGSLKWVEAGDIIPYKHCFLYPKTKLNTEVTVDMSLDMCEFLGWYIAEGYTNKGSLQLALNMYTDPIEHIISIIKRSFNCDKVYRYDYENKNCTVLSFPVGKKRAIEIKNLVGDKAVNKHLPPFVFSFTEPQIKAFLKGIISGDGCIFYKTNNKYSVVSYSTSSKRLAMDMQFLISKLGVFAGFNQQTRENRYSTKPIYRLTIEGNQVNRMNFLDKSICGSNKQYFFQDENYFYLPCTHKQLDLYEGPVYNVETSDNTYLSSFLVHNSEHRECYKIYFRCYHKEEEPTEFKGQFIE